MSQLIKRKLRNPIHNPIPELITFKYSIDSETMATYFKFVDNAVKKDKNGDFVLIDDENNCYYKLDCYIDNAGCSAGWYNLFWKINDEQSDVNEKISGNKIYKKHSTTWTRIGTNSSSPFSMASCGWYEDNDEY